MRLPGVRWIAVPVVLVGGAILFSLAGPQDRQGGQASISADPQAPTPSREPKPSSDDLDTADLRDLEFQFGAIPEFAQTVRTFAAESEDRNWSEATEARIFGAIAHASGLGVGAIQVDCRSTLCRVQLTDPRSAQDARYAGFNDLVATFGLEMLWLWAADSNGVPTNLAYLQRPVLSPLDLLFTE